MKAWRSGGRKASPATMSRLGDILPDGWLFRDVIVYSPPHSSNQPEISKNEPRSGCSGGGDDAWNVAISRQPLAAMGLSPSLALRAGDCRRLRTRCGESLRQDIA